MIEEEKCNSYSDVAAIQRETLDKLRLHFVFNTLNAVRYLIKKQPDVAYDMVYDLARYLRGSCDAIVGQELVPLEEELAFAKAYARLEEVQRSRLNVCWQAESCEGYVEAGSVYGEIEALLKQEVFGSKEPKTLVVTSDREQSLIKVCIGETGKGAVIPIQNKEDK